MKTVANGIIHVTRITKDSEIITRTPSVLKSGLFWTLTSLSNDKTKVAILLNEDELSTLIDSIEYYVATSKRAVNPDVIDLMNGMKKLFNAAYR